MLCALCPVCTAAWPRVAADAAHQGNHRAQARGSQIQHSQHIRQVRRTAQRAFHLAASVDALAFTSLSHHHLCMASCDRMSKVVPTEPVPLSYGIASHFGTTAFLLSRALTGCAPSSTQRQPLCLPLHLQERKVSAAGQRQGEAACAAGDERWQQRRGSMDSQRAAGNTYGQGV